MIIDEMGKASARAQDLKMPITTSEKLSKSDHIVYLLLEQTEEYASIFNYLFIPNLSDTRVFNCVVRLLMCLEQLLLLAF